MRPLSSFPPLLLTTALLSFLPCAAFSQAEDATPQEEEEEAPAEPPGNPNIIVFLADDMGMGDIHAYDESSTIPTPNFDRLAAEGRLFHNAHSPAAVCTPTRYGLLTGKYPVRSRLKDTVLRSAYDAPLLDPGEETIAGLLRRAGYSTAAFGKWHLGMKWNNRDGNGIAQPGVETSEFTTADVSFNRPIIEGPLDCGFDYFFGIGSSINHGPYTFIENRWGTELPTEIRPETEINGRPFREGWIAPGWKDDGQGAAISRKALDFMKQHLASDHGNPFFVYYAAVANHFPHVPPDSLYGKAVKGTGGNDDEAPDRNDMVAQNDLILGEMLALLEDPDGDGDTSDSVAANTLVIVTSDNGADVGLFEPIREKKGSIHEGGHRVPFIVRWPRTIPEGTESSALIGLNDLYATFASLTGVGEKNDTERDSESLAALFSAEEDAPGRQTPLLIQDKGGKDVTYAITDGAWKLILSQEVPLELYHLEEDLKEETNLVKEKLDIVGRLTLSYREQIGERIENLAYSEFSIRSKTINDDDLYLFLSVSSKQRDKLMIVTAPLMAPANTALEIIIPEFPQAELDAFCKEKGLTHSFIGIGEVNAGESSFDGFFRVLCSDGKWDKTLIIPFSWNPLLDLSLGPESEWKIEDR